MKRMRLIAPLLVIAALLVATVPALAAGATDLGKNWRVYNVKPATSSHWDINKAQTVAGGLQFLIQPFDTKTTGSFAVYLLKNYSVDMTGKTITAGMSWTTGYYDTRSTTCDEVYGSYVRLVFKDVASGPYDSNDYWWSTVSIDLNGPTSSDTLSASLANRDLWTNQAGLSANDTTPNWTDWTGEIVALSPYDGFTKAVENVKQVGLSYGSECQYASGVARVGGGTFTLNSFTISP